MWPDLAHFAVRHVPFANLVYLKGALDYMLWYHLYEAASPGWWERTNRRLLREQGRDGALSCDAEACLYRARGRVVALIRDGTALGEECGSADLVVSPVAAHRACRHTRIIDRNDTWRKGGYAVWLDPDRIRVETVRDWQGERPWVPQPKSGFEPRP